MPLFTLHLVAMVGSVARVRWPIHRSRPLRRTHDLEIWEAMQTSGADVMRVETRTKEMGEEKYGNRLFQNVHVDILAIS